MASSLPSDAPVVDFLEDPNIEWVPLETNPECLETVCLSARDHKFSC